MEPDAGGSVFSAPSAAVEDKQRKGENSATRPTRKGLYLKKLQLRGDQVDCVLLGFYLSERKMLRMSAKAVKIEGGEKCKKCKRIMQRFEHPPHWRPKQKQPYYFRSWDKCQCEMSQMYEAAKVILIKPDDPLTEEFKAIVGSAQ